MATAPGTEFHKRLSDVTECICGEIFTNPKTLPCIHTFCLYCLEKYGEHKNLGDPMACPLCRNEFIIPQEGFSKLPNNFFIVEIAKLATTPAKEDVCELCFEETSVAKMFCLDCEQKICDHCISLHSRIKHCQSHQVVELGYCEHHPGEIIKMYCYEDSVAICLICFAERHQSHRCENVEKAAGQFLEQLKDDLRKVTNRRPGYKEASRKLETVKTEFNEQVLKVEECIRKSGTELRNLIDDKVEELIQNLGVVRDRNLRRFEVTKHDLDTSSAMIDSYQLYCEEILIGRSSVDICRYASQMHKRAKDLDQPLNLSDDDFYFDEIAFDSTNVETLMKKRGTNNILGELRVTFQKNGSGKQQLSNSSQFNCLSSASYSRSYTEEILLLFDCHWVLVHSLHFQTRVL